MSDNPRFKHNCDRCTFLGQYKDVDLYICPQVANIPTVIARFSDDGPDYESGIGSRMPNLKEAERRAKEFGLLNNAGNYIGKEKSKMNQVKESSDGHTLHSWIELFWFKKTAKIKIGPNAGFSGIVEETFWDENGSIHCRIVKRDIYTKVISVEYWVPSKYLERQEYFTEVSKPAFVNSEFEYLTMEVPYSPRLSILKEDQDLLKEGWMRLYTDQTAAGYFIVFRRNRS